MFILKTKFKGIEMKRLKEYLPKTIYRYKHYNIDMLIKKHKTYCGSNDE